MNRKNNIYGLMLRPSSSTDEENDETWHSSVYSTRTDFLKEYQNHMAAMEIVAGCAKIYITKNWEKITDWSELDVVIEDNTKESTDYYHYVKSTRRTPKTKDGTHTSSVLDNLFSRIDEDNKKRHNPIKTITDVILDISDGDFSLTINGKSHLWISDESVIIIADYIEEKLKKE